MLLIHRLSTINRLTYSLLKIKIPVIYDKRFDNPNEQLDVRFASLEESLDVLTEKFDQVVEVVELLRKLLELEQTFRACLNNR